MTDEQKPQEPTKFACVMCGEAFIEDDLDFLGRCIVGDPSCFKKYMTLPEGEQPKLSKPFVPIYNGKAKYGF